MAAEPLKKNQRKSKVGGARPGAGRPKGSPNKATAQVREIAQQYTTKAIAALVRIVESGESEAAVVSAANALLDRGFGKPGQTIGDGDGNALDWVDLLRAAQSRVVPK